MEKKTFIGLILIMAILFLYPLFIAKLSPPGPISPAQTKNQGQATLPQPQPSLLPKQNLPQKENDTVHDTVIQNGRLWIKLTNQGAGVKEIRLIRFKDAEGKNGITISKSDSYNKNLFGWSEPFLGFDLNQAVFDFKERRSQVSYKFIIAGYIEIEKVFSLEENSDLLRVDLRMRNLQNNALPVGFSLICAGSLLKKEPFEERYLEVVVSAQDKIQHDFLRQIKNTKEYLGPVSWLALKNKYFCQVIMPFSKGISFSAHRDENRNLAVSAHLALSVVQPQEAREARFLFYAGPLDSELLAKYNIEWSKIVYYGAFDGIAKLILRVLKWGFLIFKNYGLAIILLSLLVNIILFPLTWKGMKSMQRLQKLQPQMERLRKECATDAQKLNKGIMELYRKNKVNPFGGCLPMLLQMPIFIALYQALSRSIELKGAQFLWIKDLARPDAIVEEMPFIGRPLNVLPLIMILGMYLQQKRSQAYTPTPASQKQMTWFMPLFMGLIFYPMPSGLILYWVTSTFLTLGLQGLLQKPLHLNMGQ